MSNATGRSVLGQPVTETRRSAFEATKFLTSADNTEDDLGSDFMHRWGGLSFTVLQRAAFYALSYYRIAPLSPSGRGSATPQGFSRNVPERSTFHAGTTSRNMRQRPGLYGIPSSSQDTTSLSPGGRPSNFFTKISSKFSKR